MIKSTRFRCPNCSFTCGLNKHFKKHLIEEHDYASVRDAYITTKLNNIEPKCKCTECGLSPKFNGWNRGFSKFIDGHNGSIYAYMSHDDAKKISKKRAEKLRGKEGWSRGLTKETSNSIRKAAETRSITVRYQFASGERSQWNKGLTKETSESISNAAKNLSLRYKSGELIPWAKGKTKKTDKKVLKMSQTVSMVMKQKDIRNRLDTIKRLTPDEILRRLKTNAPDLEIITDLSCYTRDRHINLEFRCKKCCTIQTKSFLSALNNRCDNCDPGGSKQQVEINRFISSMGVQTELCDRSVISPYEIDILIPEHNLGIEFNGLYFHSEVFKNRNYHADKSRMSADKGVQLIHIFEDEWRNNQDICKSMIIHKIGLTKNKVYARNCTVKEINPTQKKAFFENNHIDGNVRSRITFGLISPKNELVACISLRRPTHKKYKNMLEVARFCTKLFTHIPGGLSKLTKYAFQYCCKENYDSLLTYVDTRHGTKDGYLSAGYKFIGITGNRFWWTGGRERIDRFKIRADKESGLTEKDVAREHGVVKIWGCPNLIFEYKK